MLITKAYSIILQKLEHWIDLWTLEINSLIQIRVTTYSVVEDASVSINILEIVERVLL